ncbi:hypothetical protein JOM56_008350 [Amanita muscaria]
MEKPLDLDALPTLEVADWIGVGKKYNPSTIPLYVLFEKQNQLTVPASHSNYFSSPTLPVQRFIELSLPIQSTEIITLSSKIWFSMDSPCDDIRYLANRPIPSSDFLKALADQFGQAWFDGAQSIIDWRYNDGRERFPLWALGYWQKMAEEVEKQTLWKRSCRWLQTESAKPHKTEELPHLITTAQGTLTHLGWDVSLQYQHGAVSSSTLSALLSTAWLSDEHINMMVEEFTGRLKNISHLASRIIIAPLAFALQINSAAKRNSYTKQDAPLLYRYQQLMLAGFCQIYFPLNVNGNHWIAGIVDVEKRYVGYGDPLFGQYGAPTKFMRNLLKWLNTIGVNCTIQGDCLNHGAQRDWFSCGIIFANTISHAVFGDTLWTPQRAVSGRIQWFLTLAQDMRSCTKFLSISDLLNPADSDPGSEDDHSDTDTADLNYEDSATEHVRSDIAGDVNMTHMPRPADHIPEANPSPCPPCRDEEHGEPSVDNGDSKSEQNRNGRPTLYSLLLQTSTKRPHSPSVSSVSGNPVAKKPALEVPGDSRSAVASRTLRQKLRSGELEVDDAKLARWKEKCRTMDPDFIKVKEPYDVQRFSEHVSRCTPESRQKKAAAGAPSLWKLGRQLGWKVIPSSNKASTTQTTASLTPAPVAEGNNSTPLTYPCPGLTDLDHPRIPIYLRRTGFEGGGARSLTVIAKERFGQSFNELETALKKIVGDVQRHEHQWHNDHQNRRVFATKCEQTVATPPLNGRAYPCTACVQVLRSKHFRAVLCKPLPIDKNYVFTNHRFRSKAMGEIYARVIGLREIIETPDPLTTPCIRYAKGVLSGHYDNKIFAGLVEAMVMKMDREAEGRGMQNFRHPPAWDELCHIIKIHSPRAYRALRQHLPARSERSFRSRESLQPRFPMEICDQTFQSVVDHLGALQYTGPVNLSCDDTKLFTTIRLYWDAKEEAHFLVGFAGGPRRVADPDQVRAVIESEQLEKATKVRLWCLTIPIPKMTPLIVAALPITNSLDAHTLLSYLEKILHGLIERRVQIISYACDGTEVERSIQKQLVAKLERKITYTVKNPRPNAPDIPISIAVILGQPICMIQDSKHALKTFRNNLFSGARLLTMGNFTAIFQRIRNVAFEQGSPLYKRDVDKLDRQDDNAATRLFSADVLKYLADHHPDYIGEIIYLFIFGELIDSYQNRSITHNERFKMVLRARYFLDAWEAFLSHSNYVKNRYFLSREAADIARIVIEGYIALVLIHRDHLQETVPLLPWLHSSEVCEHVFGEARQNVKDFTFLDFIYMVPKLYVKIRHSIFRSLAADPKARASGYSHTYFDHTNIDLRALATFPSDDEVDAAAEMASQEVESLISMLGITPRLLYHLQSSTAVPVILPPVRMLLSTSSLDDNARANDDKENESVFEDDVENDDEWMSEAQELQMLIERGEEIRVTRTRAQEEQMTNLTCAALALTADELMNRWVVGFCIVLHVTYGCTSQGMADVDDEEYQAIQCEEAEQLRKFYSDPTLTAPLPAVQTADERSKVLGMGELTAKDLDYITLVEMRCQHQTPQAALGIRTRTTPKLAEDSITSVKHGIISRMHEVLKEQEERAIGTGHERAARWTQSGTQLTGNAANAAATAAVAAQRVSQELLWVCLL